MPKDPGQAFVAGLTLFIFGLILLFAGCTVPYVILFW